MTLHMLPHISKETSPNPTFSIIWLHGLGADGHDFEPIVDELNLPKNISIRFVFPHAPAMPVSLNGGYIMPSWYDIKQQDLGIEHDREGIHHSAQQIQMLIDQEVMRGIAPSHMILAGFSQGAAMSLYVGLRQPKPLGGIIMLSGYRLLPEEDVAIDSCAEHTPVFIGHGIADPVVDISLAKHAYDYLTSQKVNVVWHDYSMEHSVCPEEIADIRAWLLQRFQVLG